ncbi:hypothetical protein PG993_009244 [Apiospora rasikravindrae]|uniref:Uncharacterized protein n=1 Tax=Apiospora rasikravindrae TaxID=990691 RepID=A0ABR1SKN0_9PEZI
MSQLLSNQIPGVREKGFLIPEECEKMLAILKAHEMELIFLYLPDTRPRYDNGPAQSLQKLAR